MKDFCKLAEEYCEEVLSGKRLVCKWVIAAVERQQRDLARQDTPDFPYYFDREAANTCCAFLELFRHVQGDKSGHRLVLEKWQAFALTCTMGWLCRANGKRKYRRFFLECPKGSGKSFISSCLALFFLCASGEGGATCVAAARATNQARLVFDIARDMLRAAPDICEMFGLRVLTHSIVQPSSASTFLPVSAQGKSLAGKLLHFASCDELEFHRDRTVIDEVQLGCDKRSNSLCSVIQHPGENLLSPGYEYHVLATKILSGEISDERTWCIVYSCEGVDWKSPEAITMANPNLGVSVYESTLREAQARAIAIPGLKPTFCSHNLGLWEEDSTAKKWLTPAQVESCKQPDLKMEDFRLWAVGEHQNIIQPDMLRNFVCGIQRTSLQEPACVVYCCKGYLSGVEHFYLFPQYFEPEANDDEKLADAVLANYRNHMGYGVTLNDSTGFKIKALAHDAYIPPSARIEKNGINTLEFHKTAKTFSPVMDLLMSLLLSGRVHFADDKLAAHLLGVEAKRDLNANLFPRRSNPDKTIDAALAAFYALRLAMVPEMLNPPEQSDVKAIFISDDGSVQVSSPNGLITTHGPLEQKREGIHPADAQGMR